MAREVGGSPENTGKESPGNKVLQGDNSYQCQRLRGEVRQRKEGIH